MIIFLLNRLEYLDRSFPWGQNVATLSKKIPTMLNAKRSTFELVSCNVKEYVKWVQKHIKGKLLFFCTLTEPCMITNLTSTSPGSSEILLRPTMHPKRIVSITSIPLLVLGNRVCLVS